MSLISETDAWRSLQNTRDQMRGTTLADLFASDARRAETCALDLGDLYIDFSRQLVSVEVLGGLQALVDAAGISDFLQRMSRGDVVNVSEGRAALHTAVRGTAGAGADIMDICRAADEKLRDFVRGVHDGSRQSAAGVPFRAVVAIGIGGSELGPVLALDALRDRHPMPLDVRICGNIDGTAFVRAFDGLRPDDTLVVVISKSFTTMETQANAERAQSWMRAGLGGKWAGNFAAVSANGAEVEKFGISEANTFPMWDWVGGRYSLCSAVGLPVALAFGWEVFQEIRAGARDMDSHLLSAPVLENAPLMLALLTVWNASFMGYTAEACVPYDTRLQRMIGHLQQLEMESNGKRVTENGYPIDYATQPIVFGGIGVNAQHAFFQQLHQGMTTTPVDILLPARTAAGDEGLHDLLISGALAQADALAFGRENMAEPHRHYPGNRPSTVIVYRDLTPRILGKLIALYEHKTVCAGAIWGINPFDQWGVELGKTLSDGILHVLDDPHNAPASLVPLLGVLKRMRGA